jgi:hypothetical protein
MLSVIMLSVVMLSVIMLSVVMLTVVMLSVVMRSVIMLSVLVPFNFPSIYITCPLRLDKRPIRPNLLSLKSLLFVRADILKTYYDSTLGGCRIGLFLSSI